MLDFLLESDTKLLIAFNSFHTPFWDMIMKFVTGKNEWIPFYVLIISILVYRFKQKTLWILLATALTILFANTLSSEIMKPLFQRLRPCQVEELKPILHLLEGINCGKYGFASSHAANSFGFATLFFVLFDQQFKPIRLLFLWAFLVSYSRIYVGVHYPLDILSGAVIGIFFGWIIGLYYQKLAQKYKFLTFTNSNG